MVDFMVLKSSVLEAHQRLVELISEESVALEKEIDIKKKNRHVEIIDFLIELQILSSKEIANVYSNRRFK